MKTIAKIIIKELKKNGFIILKYESRSTNSIYLKMDYGVSHSIRISDHPGKSHLTYRFNLLTQIDESYTENERHYFCGADINKLIEAVIENRDNQIGRYSSKGYVRLMQKNKDESADKKGFWKQAVLV